MDWKTRLRRALETADGSVEEDVLEELAQHARATHEAALAEGCTADEADARLAALIERWRADAAVLRRNGRRTPAPAPPPEVSPSLLTDLGRDVTYALRLLRRQPGFTFLVVATMALGIGATTTLFGAVWGVLAKPLPWPDADRLVVLKETRGGHAPRFGSFTNAAYIAWREDAANLEELGAWAPGMVVMSAGGGAGSERVRVTAATASCLRALGVRPLLGALFEAKDEESNVVLLSESLWRRRFGGDPAAVGRTVDLDGEPHTIVGVVPDDQAYPDRRSRAWVPFHVPLATGNTLSMFEAVAKLRPGITPAQAAAEGVVRGRFAADTGMTTMAIFGGSGPVEVAAKPLREAITGDVRRPLLVLLAGVGLLLAIATTNVASLQLARATTRRRELAIRAALGATGSRAVRQLVIEGLVSGLLGGAAGVGLAWILHWKAAALLPADFPRAQAIGIDLPVAIFAACLALVVGGLVGLLPALQTRRLDLVRSLADDGGAPGSGWVRGSVARQRMWILSGQVAFACVLLVGASLVGRSFVAMLHADRGYDPSQILSVPIPMPAQAYTPELRAARVAGILDRLSEIPDVHHVAFTSETPLTPGGSTSSMTLPSKDAPGGTIMVQASPRLVSPGYFSTLGLRIVSGRPLEPSDTEAGSFVVVVNETFAKRYLKGAPLDTQIPAGVWGRADKPAAVVGVVEDVRYLGAGVTSIPEMYFPVAQHPQGLESGVATLLVRGGNSTALAGAIRTAVAETDATLVPEAILTLEDRLLSTSLARPRLYAALLGGFAVLALAVTGVGLFGALSYSVAQRTRELGIRSALGAQRRDLVQLVVRQGIGFALGGIAAGLLASAWLGRFVGTLLYGVSADDATTYVAVPVVLLAVVATACVGPAWRASRLDPVRALRS